MTPVTTEWLPAEALVEPRFLDAIGDAISSWSLDWSTEGSARLLANTASRRKGHPAESKVMGFTLRAGWSDASVLAIAGWSLGKRLDRSSVSEADRALLLIFAEAVARDLARRIEAVLGIDSADTSTAVPLTHFQIATAQGTALLEFSVPAEQLIMARKRRIQSPPASTAALMPLRRALASQSVNYTVWLGEAVLSTRDIERIEVGDVLLLDQDTHDPVKLSVATSKDARLRGFLEQEGAHFALRLCD